MVSSSSKIYLEGLSTPGKRSSSAKGDSCIVLASSRGVYVPYEEFQTGARDTMVGSESGHGPSENLDAGS